MTGACGQNFRYPPPSPRYFLVFRLSYIFPPKYQNIGVFLFQYINKSRKLPVLKKSEFAAHITLEGWQLHLEKAYPSWRTPTE